MTTDNDQDGAAEVLPNAPGSTIFVVVKVSYDYYRFQENLGAATTIERAREIAKEKGNPKWDGPIIEDEDESYAQDNKESRHLWIEKFFE